MLFYDFEVFYKDWLMVGIDPIQKREYVIVNSKNQLEDLYKLYKNDIWCGFNSRSYDQWILKAILCGFNPKEINKIRHVDGYCYDDKPTYCPNCGAEMDLEDKI